MTIRDVAHHLDVGWDLVKDIQRRELSRRYAKPKLKHLRGLAIDEIAVARGHRYLTVVMDLHSGAVVRHGTAAVPAVSFSRSSASPEVPHPRGPDQCVPHFPRRSIAPSAREESWMTLPVRVSGP